MPDRDLNGVETGIDGGPVPDPKHTQRRLVKRVVAAYAGLLAVGFASGLAVGRGPGGERLLWGVGGLLVAMTLVRVSILVVGVGRAVRDVRRQMRTPPTW